MRFEDLPDFALHQIFLECDAFDIDEIEITNKKCYNIVQRNRLHYRKKKIRAVVIEKTEDDRTLVFLSLSKFAEIQKILTGSLHDAIRSWQPEELCSFDHEELANIHVLWWKNVRKIFLTDVVDYRRYVLHFDRLTEIYLESALPKNLTEILQFMETKHLEKFSVVGKGELECTDDDLRKIGRLSCRMHTLRLINVSQSSNVSIDGVLDMIEKGSFARSAWLNISRIQGIENMEQCKKERKWISKYVKPDIDICCQTFIDIFSNIDDMSYCIEWE